MEDICIILLITVIPEVKSYNKSYFLSTPFILEIKYLVEKEKNSKGQNFCYLGFV